LFNAVALLLCSGCRTAPPSEKVILTLPVMEYSEK